MSDMAPVSGTVDDNSLSERAQRHLWMHFTRLGRLRRPPRGAGDGARRRAPTSGTSTASATSTACRGSSPARSATAGPSWPRRRPSRPASWPTSRCGPTPTRGPSSWPSASPAWPPGDLNRVFFTTGGSEAVESAWKLARQYFRLIGRAGPDQGDQPRHRLPRHHHGRAVDHRDPRPQDALRAARARGRQGAQHQLLPGPEHGDDLEAFGRWAADEIDRAIEREGPETVAAVYLEPVQNAGGCFPPPPGYFARVREICDRYGVLLVSDEVICAFGRLGEWFGAVRYGYQPDIITVAKGLTSGYAPLGAMIASDRLVEPFLHGDRQLRPRLHLRRPPGELRRGPGQPRRLRARRHPRPRPAPPRTPSGPALRDAWTTCPSWATSAATASSTASSW